MVAPFDQAFHSNNSNVEKHINTTKLSIKQSPLSCPFYLTLTDLMRHENNKKKHLTENNQGENSLVKLHNIMLRVITDIVQWVFRETLVLKYIVWTMVMLVLWK